LAAFWAEFNATRMMENFANLVGAIPDILLRKWPK